MKRNKLLLLGGIVMLLSALFGCMRMGHSDAASNLPGREESVKASLVQQLEEKYGDSFTVEQLEQRDAGMAFTKGSYKASVRSGTYGGTFTARVDSDGNSLTDDYPRLFWNDAIEERVRRALDSMEDVDNCEWQLVYVLSAQTWTEADDLDAYLSEDDTYLDLNLTLPSDLDQAAADLNGLRAALQQEHLQYAVSCTCGGSTVVFAEKKGQPQLTDEQIRQKLERSVS